MAQAINYTLNQWEALNRYVEQGFLNIDNNAVSLSASKPATDERDNRIQNQPVFSGFLYLIRFISCKFS
jgi:hypothetical protein